MFGYTERRLARPCKQENIVRKGVHVWGWVATLRRLWKKRRAREETKERRGGARLDRMRGCDAIPQEKGSPADS